MKPVWFFYYIGLEKLYKNKKVFLYWFNLTQNFGDTINPIFIEHLSGKKVQRVDPKRSPIEHIIAIGSVMEHCSSKSVIWGSGFISATSELTTFPNKVLAVRGPKSRQRLLEYGITCPEVYGDPILLLPKIYTPKTDKKYKYGFVPHFSDKNEPWLKSNIEDNENILIIDLQKDNVFEVIDEIASCERIVSSSLHGIITADAYEIPSVWIEFSDKVIGKGFKFLDYFESVGRKDTEAYRVEPTSTLEDIEALFYDYSISIDLDLLLEAAPFKVKKELLVSGKDE